MRSNPTALKTKTGLWGFFFPLWHLFLNVLRSLFIAALSRLLSASLGYLPLKESTKGLSTEATVWLPRQWKSPRLRCNCTLINCFWSLKLFDPKWLWEGGTLSIKMICQPHSNLITHMDCNFQSHKTHFPWGYCLFFLHFVKNDTTPPKLPSEWCHWNDGAL